MKGIYIPFLQERNRSVLAADLQHGVVRALSSFMFDRWVSVTKEALTRAIIGCEAIS